MNEGYIHCNSQEEFDNFKQWISSNGYKTSKEFEYNINYIYSINFDEYFYKSNNTYNDFKSNNSYCILEWSDYMNNNKNNNKVNQFTKDMLEDFMVVETNEEEDNRYIKIKDKLVQPKSFNNLNDYNDNLKYNAIIY